MNYTWPSNYRPLVRNKVWVIIWRCYQYGLLNHRCYSKMEVDEIVHDLSLTEGVHSVKIKRAR